jgi:hypothetical protein
MPKITSKRTFTACWTCRRRGISCDTASPSCSQCIQSRIQCEGYQIRLVWVDSSTGDYTPQQRRTYPCHLTWDGYPHWTLREVAHLVEQSEQQACRCSLHNVMSPFFVFRQHEPTEGSRDDDTDSTESTLTRSSDTDSISNTFDDTTFIDDDTVDSTATLADGTPHTPAVPVEFIHRVGVDKLSQVPFEPMQDTSSKEADNNLNTKLAGWLDVSAALSWRKPSLYQSLNVSRSAEESRLLHHYLATTSTSMVPIDDIGNPWRLVYPSIAFQTTSSNSARSLYHAMLAQSAYHLSNLRDVESACYEKKLATRHYGAALSELRKSLASPRDGYCSTLAALLACALAEHVFRGEAPGWQVHFQAAGEFVCQYARSRPWTLSKEAWTVTQNFALEVLISQTSQGVSENPSGIASKVRTVLRELMDEPAFGYSHGGTAHVFRALYHVQCFEERLALTGIAPDIGSMEIGLREQLRAIIEQLSMPVDDEVEVYIEHRLRCGVDVSSSMRELITQHLQLFTDAVMIYLFSTVLRYPPCAVHQKTTSVLTATTGYIELQHTGAFSIWPVFIAATQAYTPELQESATQCLDVAEKTGSGNRREVQRVVRQIWLERQTIAQELHCDPGAVFVNWRKVMKRLNGSVLLL